VCFQRDILREGGGDGIAMRGHIADLSATQPLLHEHGESEKRDE
jgi:hypothetical protein